MTRFIFITGGVVSSLGKGLTTAALGALLQARGYKVRLRKLDPYLNVDPGTMSPFEHGEVFVTDDGAETDLDLGHYERFTGVAAKKTDSISSGKIYSNVLDKERKGDYLGKTIQVIPHVTDEIKKFIEIGEEEVDFMLCEIGGTVGDIEGLPFFEAIRQFSQEKGVGSCIFMHLTLVPFIQTSGELKTKPTQHSVKELRSIGLTPDILVCRAKERIPEEEISKLKLSKPTFFSTMCCLAHLEDDDVLGILKTIDKIAPVGSVLACSEPWGDFYHRQCWNIRPPEWWSDTLANWEFEFYNDYIITDPPGRSKGFIATRL